MLTLKEAAKWMAEKLGRDSFPEDTIRGWIWRKKLRPERVGGKNFIRIEDLEIFLPENLRHTQPVLK